MCGYNYILRKPQRFLEQWTCDVRLEKPFPIGGSHPHSSIEPLPPQMEIVNMMGREIFTWAHNFGMTSHY